MNILRTQLTPELSEVAGSIAECARKAGLDFYDTIFELVDHKDLNAIAAYHGFPSRYPHWRWGMSFDRLAKTYRFGLSAIYELVVNTDPSYAYLMRSNPMVLQKTVIAHVYGHVDFFKHNYWFSRTNRKMLDQAANHAQVVRKFIDSYGEEEVEGFVDTCLCLDNLLDVHAPFKVEAKEGGYAKEAVSVSPSKLQAKKYMDNYVNPKAFLEAQKEQQKQQELAQEKFPVSPQRDILWFLMEHAPLKDWQKRILGIIRDEAYYFAPQAQTKIINEGWASYWHSKIMTELHPLQDSEIIDFCDLHSGVVAEQGDQINPYRLGIELLRHVKKRWDEGKFGLDYISMDDPKQRREHNKLTGLGEAKLFEVRKWHNDVTFVDEFLDEDFCHEHKFLLYRYEPKTQQRVIVSKDFAKIKKKLLDGITNLGGPIVEVVDGNYKNRGELLLEHKYTGRDLKVAHIEGALKAMHSLWNRPVHLLTSLRREDKRCSFDSNGYTMTKA